MILRLSALFNATPWAAAPALLACSLLLLAGSWLSLVDYRTRLLPDRIVLPAAAAALLLLAGAALLAADPAALSRVFGGAAGLSTGYLVLHLIHPPGLGLGDVKLALFLGSYLGYLSWWHLLYGALAAFLIGSCAAMLLVLRRGWSHGRRADLAFGPAMVLGCLMVLLIPG